MHTHVESQEAYICILHRNNSSHESVELWEAHLDLYTTPVENKSLLSFYTLRVWQEAKLEDRDDQQMSP